MSNEHITDERAAFEAWFRDNHGSRVCFSQYDTGTFKGDYRDALVAGAWNVWQASRAALRPAAQPVGAPAEEYGSGNQELTEALLYALDALSLALSDVDWRVGSPTQPVLHKAHNRLSRALRSTPAAQPVAVPDRVPMTDEKCKTCNGHGLVGGYMADGSGYGEGCPDCNPEPYAPVDPEMLWNNSVVTSDWEAVDAYMQGIADTEAHHGITTPKADK